MSHSDKEKEFTALIQGNQGIIHKVCHTYTNDQMAHDDLFQEIVLQLWKSYDSFKGNSKFTTWMYRVGINTAISLYRKKKSRPESSNIEDYHFKIKAEEKDENLVYQLQMLKNAIQKLNDVERALVLLYLDDLPYKEISETLGISEVNARVKMNRVKKKLKEMLNPHR
ncbi:sigma-70 family RNA polymerase sigma factor [Flavobacteriaceae bacterium Ap0902]|nr:sigma-70 family RNA polymerase sigma factor [Flavobacteriaceae bacterium Ap0902]